MTAVSRPGRLVAYAAAGWGVDACFTAFHSLRRTGRPRRSSLWNAPVYGLAQPLFEPVHDRLRGRASATARGLCYAVGILAVDRDPVPDQVEEHPRHGKLARPAREVKS